MAQIIRDKRIQCPVELVERAYEAWNRGDIPAVVEIAHPEFAWGDPPELIDACEGRGRSAFECYLRKLDQIWDELRWEPEEFRTAGDLLLVVVTGLGRGRRSGVPVAARFFHLWRVRDGRALRMDGYLDEGEARERLMAASRSQPCAMAA